MKKFLSLLAIAAMVSSFMACSDDDDDEDPVKPDAEVVVVKGSINANTTWTKDKIYELDGRVIVTNGIKLTIEAGTIIKGQEGEGADASALMIARGGVISAVGTAEEPIIFTSVLDDIQPGQKAGTTLDVDDKGKWGGLVILGKAPISVAGATEAQIEGVPAGETLGLYGGDAANDDSGDLRYISIRHGGTVLTGGSEINGLTLGGVGNGTSISDIEIFGNVDDGVEFFGGTVNVSNILVSYQGDDGIDIDQAYAGTINGFMVIHGGDTDEALEIDGPEGAANADGKFTLKNGTIVGDPTQANDASSLADIKSKAQGSFDNIVFKGYPANKAIKIAASYNGECGSSSNAYSKLVNEDLTFSTVQFTGYVVNVYNATEGSACSTTTDTENARELVVSAAATGGPAIATWNWTISQVKSLIK
ncbi:hypothetical protein [Pseudochryseolinea flava]|uniref:T9SS C-terminal target domain-containing protein n=1 Tax=Pseudochryseolinea flava TaxID=2059302 RepID=A0A364Y7E4_9BACT|nr:hypothetical protein [Pseudochryseolinea flava]RAW03034.1 hypothetical protein DQQ10_02745 [Pseudochryseolinea flava]